MKTPSTLSFAYLLAAFAWLIHWAPHICVATMVLASVSAGFEHDWRKCVFWALDAAITGWSAFMLR